jgi:hypothetical protein
MQPGAVAPLSPVRGITVHNHRTSAHGFFVASPKAENIVAEPKAKERPSDHRRFILHQPKIDV